MAQGRSTSPMVPVLLFTLAAGAATYGVYRLAGWAFGPYQVGTAAFLGALTAVLHTWQEKALVTDPKGFVRRFMLGLTIKLMAALAAMLIILLLLPKEEAVMVALTFAALYLVFLAFSTARLSARSRAMPRP